MLDFESQYLWILLKLWLKMVKAKVNGRLEKNRTAVKTVSMLGQVLSVKVSENRLPVLTTKQIYLHGVIVELIWFLNGDSNIRFLLQNRVDIWTGNAFAYNKKLPGFPGMDINEYRRRIREDAEFAKKYGNLGGVYGAIWRNFAGIDQIQTALKLLRDKPESRQNLITAWNPVEIPNVALPPCHFAFQLHVKDGKLSLSMFQRSADWFLGVPFNITSYALLLLLFAKHAKLEPDRLYIHFGDAHLYENHMGQAFSQILRWPLKKRPPSVVVLGSELPDTLENIPEGVFSVHGYKHLGPIKAEMAV
jgi:thymidylate synthase